MADLSVIIVSYNTRDLLLRCLSSLSEASSGLSCEILVVDNGSADGSAAAVEKAFPGVRLIRNAGNRGFAGACNQGLREVSGRFLLLLNSDAMMTAGALTALLSFLGTTPGAGAVGGQLTREDGSLQNSFDNFPTLATELLNKSLLKRLFPGHYRGKGEGRTLPVEVESLIGAAMMVRREVLDTVGLLDEGYFFFLEETDWCLRMRQKGWKIYFDPRARILHLQGQSARQVLPAARIEYYRSRYRFFSLHRSRFSGLVLRSGLFLRLCVETLFSLLLSGLTLFLYPKEVERLTIRSRILAWHLLGCPEQWGLRRSR